MLTVRIDTDACFGHGCCWSTAPDVYELDDAGMNVSDGRIVPAKLVAAARNGAAACPEHAIRLVEDDPALVDDVSS